MQLNQVNGISHWCAWFWTLKTKKSIVSNCFIQDFISYFADLEKGIKKETRWIIPSKLTKTNFEDQLGMGISVEWNGKDNVLNRENIFYWMYIGKRFSKHLKPQVLKPQYRLRYNAFSYFLFWHVSSYWKCN